MRGLFVEAMNTEFSYREITKPLRPLGKAASLLLEILGLLCKSVVSESLSGVMHSGLLLAPCGLCYLW